MILPKNTSLGLAFFSKQEVSEVFFFEITMPSRFGKQVSWSVSYVENGVGLDVAEIHSGKHQQKVAFHTWLLMALNKSVHTLVKVP